MKWNILVLLFCYIESIVLGLQFDFMPSATCRLATATLQSLPLEGLRIPWKFKSLPKEKALAMTRALEGNARRYGSDVRSKYLDDVRRALRISHERHLFRNSYRNGKFLFQRRYGFRWLYPNITRRRYNPNVSFIQEPMDIKKSVFSWVVLFLSSKLSSFLLKKRTEENFEISPMLDDEFNDYMSSRMIF